MKRYWIHSFGLSIVLVISTMVTCVHAEVVGFCSVPEKMPRSIERDQYSPPLCFEYAGLKSGQVYNLKVWLLSVPSFLCASSQWCERVFKIDNTDGSNASGKVEVVENMDVFNYSRFDWLLRLYNGSGAEVANDKRRLDATDNRPPALGSIGDRIAFTGYQLNFNVNANDSDGNNVTLSGQHLPNGASFNTVLGDFKWIPDAVGKSDMVFIAEDDGDGVLQDGEQVTISVTEPTEILFREEFESDAPDVDRNVWTTPEGDAAFFGRTAIRNPNSTPGDDDLIKVEDGVAKLLLSTYNPTAEPSAPEDSFWGSEIDTIQRFSFTESGLAFKAKVRSPMERQCGNITAFFGYDFTGSHGRFRDEIDFEFLSNLYQLDGTDPEVLVNRYVDEEDGIGLPGRPVYISVPEVDFTDWNIFEIRWYPGRIEWFINDELVHMTTEEIPTGPLSLRLNTWAPHDGFSMAYCDELKPTTIPSENVDYVYEIDWVEVSVLDIDLDGVISSIDNCTRVANSDQRDTDNDNIGNMCDCDFNQDDFCGGPDFTLFIGCFNKPPNNDPVCEAADMNGDGFVGGPDFTRFIGGFNGPPGPPTP